MFSQRKNVVSRAATSLSRREKFEHTFFRCAIIWRTEEQTDSHNCDARRQKQYVWIK